MQLIGLVRLGRDAELRTLPDGTPVMNLAMAYNWGKRDQSGNRQTTWVDGALFGSRAEALAQYMVKGQQLCVTVGDVHIRTYDKSDGSQGFSLSGTVREIEFAGSAQQSGGQQGGQQRQQPQQRQAPQGQQRGNGGYQQQRQSQQQPQRQQEYQGGGSGFDDMDTDIPFATSSFSFDAESKLDRRIRRANRTRHES